MWTWARPGRGLRDGAGRAEEGVGAMLKASALWGGGERCSPISRLSGLAGVCIGITLRYLALLYRRRERGNSVSFSAKLLISGTGFWYYVRSHSSNLPILEFGSEKS